MVFSMLKLSLQLRRVAFRASLSLGLVGCVSPLMAQQTQGVSIQVTKKPIPAMPASMRSEAPVVAADNTALVSQVDSRNSVASDAKNLINTDKKGPIKLPGLATPNIEIEGSGTGKMPDDFVTGRMPEQRVLPYGPDRQLSLAYNEKTWTAPVFCHQPLYYEDTMLERHGHERFPLLTPAISGARFYTGLFFTPYLATLRRPLVDYPNTGHFRPGSAAPAIRERAPYDHTALGVQVLSTGAVFAAAQP